jgi:hypothetical protein
MRWVRKVLGVFSRRSSFKKAGSREMKGRETRESDVGDKTRNPESRGEM